MDSDTAQTATSDTNLSAGISSSSGSAGHKCGYDKTWERQYPWLLSVSGGAGMLCSLCRRHNTCNKRNGSTVWSKKLCTTLRKDAVRRHSKSAMHAEAVTQEDARIASQASGGIKQALESQLELRKHAVIGAMKSIYWLAKQEIPHTTNYVPLLNLARSWGCEFVDHLFVGRNATYCSERMVQEFLDVLASQIEIDQHKDIFSSQYISLMTDETTDIAVVKELVLYARYLAPDGGAPKSTFLKIRDLVDGTAESIYNAITQYCETKDIPLSKCVGFGSDGANVMTGIRSGVCARLKVDNPYLVGIHCIAHRLALAAAQACDKVPYIKNTFTKTLTNLFYFYENSAVRMSGLHSIETILDDPEIKLKRALHVRWLSHEHACQALRRILPSVIVSLDREASERGEPVAAGLSKMIIKYKFVASLYLLCDILPHLNRLSCMFQSADIDLSLVQPHVLATVTKLKQLRENPGNYLKALDHELSTSLKDWDFNASDEAKASFKSSIQIPYVDALIDNINNRFGDAGLISAFSIFDPTKLPQSEEEAVEMNYGDDSLNTLIDHYGCGSCPLVSSEDTKSEWLLFVIYMIQNCKRLSMKDILQTLSHNSTVKSMYPNLSTLATICQIIPVTTVDCERGFSTMKRIKTRLRSVMKMATLDSLMRISIEGADLEHYDFDRAVNSWGSKKNRRIF